MHPACLIDRKQASSDVRIRRCLLFCCCRPRSVRCYLISAALYSPCNTVITEPETSRYSSATSIFDYCSVPSIRRWLSDKLTIEESVVYKEYCRLLRIATADAIFSKGGTFDLMYANPTSGHFDSDRQFAWMRGYAGSAMAIVANFADHPVDVDVVIPKEAFEFFGLKSGSRAVHFHVGAHDYTRIDVSHLG